MSVLGDLARGARDAADILRRARNPLEAAKALVPAALLTRVVLNGETGGVAPMPAAEVAATLRRLTRRLEGELLGEGGRGVDYGALRGSATFAELVDTSRLLLGVQLLDVPPDAATRAFWINLYNVLVIHGVVALGVRRSVMEVPSFFGTVAYRIGDFLFTPDEIENGILRGNAPHPATGRRLFARGDPRLALALTPVDARVHAALVCAARACPPIAFYDGDQLDPQLDLAARTFVTHDTEVDDAARAVRVSILYRYYARDFGGDDGVRRFLVQHAEGEHRARIARALSSGFALEHRRYDWDLNRLDASPPG
ncbi:MAG: DUF547 domain-containing protein [Deltaproteobacteria bacterium]|nr:DUF547 domain-containing protein [Deltaproteobacteria bacterium]